MNDSTINALFTVLGLMGIACAVGALYVYSIEKNRTYLIYGVTVLLVVALTPFLVYSMLKIGGA